MDRWKQECLQDQKAGHDKDKVYVIKEDWMIVYISFDLGRRKRFMESKEKEKKHVSAHSENSMRFEMNDDVKHKKY